MRIVCLESRGLYLSFAISYVEPEKQDASLGTSLASENLDASSGSCNGVLISHPLLRSSNTQGPTKGPGPIGGPTKGQ